MGDSAERESLVKALRGAAEAFAALVPHAVSLGPGIAEAIQDAINDIEPTLGKSELVLAVVGEPAARRALLRVVLGENVIKAPAARRERVTRIRQTESFDYVARESSGIVTRFARSTPDRDSVYKQSIEEAEQAVRAAMAARSALETNVERSRKAVRAAEESLRALEDELEAAGRAFADAWRAQKAAEVKLADIEKAAPEIPALFLAAPPWWALWLWLLRWLTRGKWREPLALHAHNRALASNATSRATDLTQKAQRAEAERETMKVRRESDTTHLEQAQAELARIEVVLSEECQVAAANAHVEQLLRERSRHAGERKDEFFSDLHEIDATARGDTIGELEVHLPSNHAGAPPENAVLLFSAGPYEEADGFVAARNPNTEPAGLDELRKRLPHAATITIRPNMERELHGALVQIKSRNMVVPAKLAMRLRSCIADIARARSVAEVEHQRRLGALESQRIPHPAEFRTRQMARSEPAIEKGADDVLASGIANVKAGFEALRKEWLERVTSATNKKLLDDCIRDINQRGKLRVLELLEATSEHIAREMQSIGETLERWALDEVQTSYRTAKKMRAESLAPVASEVTGEDLATPIAALVPIAGARETFQRQRLFIGLGGAIACAAAGTFVRPGIGTAIGAFVGIFSAFIKSSASLRKASLARVEEYVTTAEDKICQRLRDGRQDLANGIRSSLDEALADTLERLNESITRLMSIEREAIGAERAMLAKLDSTRGTLEEHDQRLRESLALFERGGSQMSAQAVVLQRK